jgi:4-amino-4-deoxy-L-arabinose transferase-like glycosyltransferase
MASSTPTRRRWFAGPTPRIRLAPAAGCAPDADFGFQTRAAILYALAAAMLAANLGGRRSLDGHEVLVAQTAKEMAASGDWRRPTFNGQPRYEKPPLAYWVVASVYLLTGTANEWTARAPSAAAAFLLVVLVVAVGRRWFGPAAGLWAGLFQATAFWSIAYGKSALVDMILALLVALAVLAPAADRLLPRALPTGAAATAFWCFASLAVLAKGPVALAFILPPVLLYRWIRTRLPGRPNDVRFVRTWWHAPGVALFLVAAGAWPAVVLAERPDVGALWYAQSLGRFASHYGPQTRPWYYYLYQAPFLTLPWSVLWIAELLRPAAPRSPRGRADESPPPAQPAEYWLLWIWFGAAFLILTFSAGKREHYLLPALTPLSLLAALRAEAWRRRLRDARVHARPGDRRRLSLDLIARLPVERTGRVAATLATFAAAGFFASEYWVAPRLDRWAAARRMVERQTLAVQSADLVVLFGVRDNAPVFFLDRPIRRTADPVDLRRFVAESGAVLVFAAEDAWKGPPRDVCARTLDRCPGFLLATMHAAPCNRQPP